MGTCVASTGKVVDSATKSLKVAKPTKENAMIGERGRIKESSRIDQGRVQIAPMNPWLLASNWDRWD